MNRNKNKQRFLWLLALLLGSVLSGVIGYMMIEGYSLLEALYMTVITIGTVGYGEVKPLSSAGKIFTMVIIFVNIGVVAYSLSTLAAMVVEGRIRDYFKSQRETKKIGKMNKHIIVCGYGRNGKQICQELLASKQPFVVIERDSAATADLENQEGAHLLIGDATQDEVLLQAGVMRARALVTALPSDPANVYVVLTARGMNAAINIISRASDESSELKLKRAGANHVIMPEKIGGSYMASLVLKPDISEFMASFGDKEEMEFAISEISASDLLGAQSSKKLYELRIRETYGVIVIGIKTRKGDYIFSPGKQEIVEPGAFLIVLGSSRQMETFGSHKHTGQAPSLGKP